MKNKQNGITMVSLIVTIIVLIILAGVTISALTNSRLIKHSENSKVITEIQNFKEKVAIARMSLEIEIASKVATEPGYIATTNDNFRELTEKVAKEFNISAEDIITSSIPNDYKIASTQDVMLSKNLNREGYTISSALDIIGNSNTEGHGYITIWYTSNGLRSNINRDAELNQYEIANFGDTNDETNSNENQAVLMAIMHVRNNSSETISFDLNGGNTTNCGLTTVENAVSNAGKKLKETNYVISTKEYSILTLDSNNGSNEKSQEYMKVGNSYVVPQNSYNRLGYTFKNWNTSANGMGTDYYPGDIITDTTNNIELYAEWEAIEYTISYNLNGGTTEETNPFKYTIESNNIMINPPSKEGHYFTGWTGSNGNTPQTEVVIENGSTGNKSYEANYAQYTQASLRTFNASDSNVSWSFNSGTGVYSITQKANSSGWGVGVVCDDSKTDINWEKSYMLEFEIKLPGTYTLKTDGNAMFSSDGSGNDIYGSSWLIVDGNRVDGAGFGNLPQSTAISGGTWHKVQMYLVNNSTKDNASHKPIRSYSGFALDLSSVSSNVTYEMRNLKSIVY